MEVNLRRVQRHPQQMWIRGGGGCARMHVEKLVGAEENP